MLVPQFTAVDEGLALDQSTPLETIFRPKPEKVPWVTSEIAEIFGREYYIVTAAREMIFYLIFLFCASMAVVAKIDTNAYYMTSAIKGQVIENKFIVNEQKITFYDIRTIQDLHIYLTEYLSMNLYWTSFDTVTRVQLIPNKDRGVLYSNKLIGVPVMRQLAMTNNTCNVHPRFERHFHLTCKEGYRHSVRLKDDPLPGCTVNDGCNYVSSTSSLAVSYYGYFAHYGADGYQVKMGQDRQKFIATAEAMKNGGWYMQTTRVIFLDFMLYNPNLDLFCAVKLIFEHPPVGGVFPKAYFHTFEALTSMNSVLGQFGHGCLIVYGLFILYYLAEEIREIIYLKFKYFQLFWSYIDVLIIVLVIIHIVFTIHVKIMARRLIGPMSENSADIENFSLQGLAYYDYIAVNAQGLAVFFIYMKLFKYLSLNIVTGQLNNTLKRSADHLFYFSLIFFLMLLAFAEFGYLVFGTEIGDYYLLRVSMFTLLRTTLGDFNYEVLEKTHYFMAPLFFVMYIFMVFFVLVNMFLAIVCSNYTYVKTDMAVGPEVMQMTEFWKRGVHNLCQALHCGACAKFLSKRNEYNVAAEQIRGILKRCGFSDTDVDVFMARYDIEPADLIRVHDMSKLLEFLRIPAAENMTPRKGPVPQLEVKPTGPPIMAMEDFKAQQDKLTEIETYIGSIAERLETLLKKLEALEDIRK